MEIGLVEHPWARFNMGIIKRSAAFLWNAYIYVSTLRLYFYIKLYKCGIYTLCNVWYSNVGPFHVKFLPIIYKKIHSNASTKPEALIGIQKQVQVIHGLNLLLSLSLSERMSTSSEKIAGTSFLDPLWSSYLPNKIGRDGR